MRRVEGRVIVDSEIPVADGIVTVIVPSALGVVAKAEADGSMIPEKMQGS